MQLYKLYKKGNYTYIERIDAAGKKYTKRYASIRLTYVKSELSFDIYERNDLTKPIYNIGFDYGISANGTPFSEAGLETFLDETTSPIGGDASATNQVISNNLLTSIDSKIPPLGQALISTSLPVVLPQSQIDALTPPPAITGFNLESTQQQIKANQVLEIAELTAINTKLSQDKIVQDNILLELKKAKDFEEHWVYDKTNVTKFYKVRSILNQTTGLIDTSILNLNDSIPAPMPNIDNLTQAVSNIDYEFNSIERKAITAGVGYAVGDRIQELQIINMTNGSLINTIWMNKTTDLPIATPVFSHLIIDDTYAVKSEQIIHNQHLQNIVSYTGGIYSNLGQQADLPATVIEDSNSLIAIEKYSAKKLNSIADATEGLLLPNSLIYIKLQEILDATIANAPIIAPPKIIQSIPMQDATGLLVWRNIFDNGTETYNLQNGTVYTSAIPLLITAESQIVINTTPFVPIPFFYTPSALNNGQSDISDVAVAGLLIGSGNISLITNLTAFQNCSVNSFVISDGLARVIIVNQTGETINLPRLDFKYFK